MNKRIRKKKNCPYIQLKKYKPDEIAVFTFDINDENFDMDYTCRFFEQVTSILPKGTSAMMLPNFLSIKSEDKESFREFLDRAEEYYEQLH